jgi:dTDP-4-amino-4,6-dideoxygalactose transaminase
MRAAPPDRLYLSPPHPSGREREWLDRAIASRYLAPVGPFVDEFERRFAARFGFPDALAVSSGTAAVQLALRGLGVGPGDTVFCATLTFVGSVAPAVQLGATPVFLDSDEATWCLDPDLLAAALRDAAGAGRLPKAVIAVDLYGQCCDYDRLRAACAPYGVPLLGDAAEAVGASYRGRPAGQPADVAVYSFNGNKIITTSGGGMLAAPDAARVARARHLANQARDPAPHYEHSELGYNHRLSNLLAAVGCAQLDALEERVAAKRAIFAQYRERLSGLPGVGFMPEAPYGRANRWLTVIVLDPAATPVTPGDLRLALEAGNIEARPLWKPMHLQPVFAGSRAIGGAVSESLFRRGLCLPSGTAMTAADVDRVCAAVARRLLNGAAARSRA